VTVLPVPVGIVAPSKAAVPPPVLRFLWWNVQSFAHFERPRAGEDRWPLVADEYAAKRARVDAVLAAVLREHGRPHVLALAEITRTAAHELRDRLFPGYSVLSLDQAPRPEMQVAILYDAALPFREQAPIVASGVPRGTRPMAALDYDDGRQQIRWIACHWQARFGEQSDQYRSDVAQHLARYVYQYLRDERSTATRHVVILGDLNEEPYGLPEKRLHAARSRARSLGGEHYSDRDVERVHLYNCSFRLLGERRPHDGSHGEEHVDVAGTYYWRREKTWHTFDQVIVSGSLLSHELPHLREDALGIARVREAVGEDGTPQKFEWGAGKPRGISDHVPIYGAIALTKEDGRG
jgi:endonuclease/exonuclease/phosphatase family metal-dependent hydrolase